MFEINNICKIIKGYIDEKVEQFIIYPFGVNGLNTKNILMDFFNLHPCYIVDNEYSKYNQEIIDSSELKSVYKEDMCVILTIENKEANQLLEKELLEFVPRENIMNLLVLSLEHRNTITEKFNGIGFRIADFITTNCINNINKSKERKIKVRIAHSNPNMWNSLLSVCRAFYKDSRFDLIIIVSSASDNFRKKSIAQIQKNGFKFCVWDEYRVEYDVPDILILSNPYDKVAEEGGRYRKYTSLVVVYSYDLIIYSGLRSVEEFWEYQQRGYEKSNPDYYLFDSLIYKELHNSHLFTNKIIEIGNAKFDTIYTAIREKKYLDGWEKLKNKTTVLWTTSHGIHSKGFQPNLTFDLYAKTIFEYVSNNQELGVIFRPHSSLIEELLINDIWSEHDYNYFKEFCRNSTNIVYDDTDNYDLAFSIADGILTDACCGIICSALPTLKPICAVYRSKESYVNNRDLLENYYSVFENNDIIKYFDMLRNKDDTMLQQRKKAMKKYVKSFDGKNGYRIKEFILNKFCEKFK